MMESAKLKYSIMSMSRFKEIKEKRWRSCGQEVKMRAIMRLLIFSSVNTNMIREQDNA